MTLPRLTKKQQTIPSSLLRFRFLKSTQIQKLFHHKDKRRINSWLKDLNEKEYITKYEDPVPQPTKAAVYRLAINGIRYMSMQGVDKKLLHKLYREGQRSTEFIAHSLLIADIFLDLRDHTIKDDSFSFYTQSDYLTPGGPYTFLSELSPDVYLTRRTGKGKTRKYLLHNIPESMLRFRSYKLRKKIRDYMSFYFTNSWENRTKVSFPTLLFILPDTPALIYLQRYIQTILNDNGNPKISFWLRTKNDIQKHGFTGRPWEEVE